MWNRLSFGAFSSSLSLPVTSWWGGWSSAGPEVSDRQLPVTIHRNDPWTDFFFGEAQTARRHSLLDGKAKVALHYCTSDIDRIAEMPCPSSEIPTYLWQKLQQQHSKSSFASRKSHG